jgi:hypothetical protein
VRRCKDWEEAEEVARKQLTRVLRERALERKEPPSGRSVYFTTVDMGGGKILLVGVVAPAGIEMDVAVADMMLEQEAE